MLTAIKSSNIPIISSGLGLYFDAAYKQSYPGSGTTWTDLRNGTICTIGGAYAWYSGNGGYFSDFANFNTTFQIATGYSATSLSGLTMQAIVRFDRGQYENATLLGSTNSGGNDFKLTPTGIVSDGGSRQVSTSLTTGVYYFISCTRDVPSLSLSVRINNGSRTTNTYGSLGNVNFTDGWMISANRTGGVVLLDPRVACVIFYTRTLSVDEEVHNFNALRLRFGL
jgi:hypothetical protein